MTATEPTYAELLKDPRWKATSEAVMEFASHRCQSCGAEGVRMNAHHTYYKRGLMPWEYPLDSLRCWCEDCHGDFHELKDKLQTLVADMTVGTFRHLVMVARRMAAVDRHAALEDRNPELAAMVLSLCNAWKVGG